MSPDTSAPTAARIQGWCPGALRPMASGDGLVVRVRPVLGRLSPAQAHGLAALAQQYALPMLELTNRANLQLRGVLPEYHPTLLQGLQALQLLDADPIAEARRNLLAAPFWTEEDGTPRVCLALSQALAAPDAPALPGKFGFAVDLGATPVLRTSPADIRVERVGDLALVYADGARTGAAVPLAQAAHAAMALARWFVAAGGVHGGRGRMVALLERQPLPEAFTAMPVPAEPASTPPPGPVPTRSVGPSPAGCVVAFEFGQLPAQTLAHLATLGPLRITPWRGLLLEGVASPPLLPELITRADDVRLRVMACTGAPGCSQALGPTRPLARWLAPLLPAHRTAHVAGCSKGCAHHGATLTLVASGTGYDLIPHGHAHSPPLATGLSAAGIAAYLQEQSHAPHV